MAVAVIRKWIGKGIVQTTNSKFGGDENRSSRHNQEVGGAIPPPATKT